MRQKPPVDEEGDQIEDEVGDSYVEEDGIEDFYGDDTFKDGAIKDKVKEAGQAVEGAVEAENMDEDDLDLDYSQTHLDDFLKSHTSSTMLKGSNIQSGQLLNSFLSTYNKMKSGTGLSSLQGTGGDNQNNLGQRKGSQAPPEMIRENDDESIATEKKDDDLDDDSEEELGRSDCEINLEQVSVKSIKSSASAKQRAILSPEEVKKIQDEADAVEREKAALKEHEEQAIKLNMKTM